MSKDVTLAASYLPQLRNTALIPGWRWKPNGAPALYPAQMETRHLFFTLRMIWNHSMPEHMNVSSPGETTKQYVFSKRYTKRYFGEAIIQIGRELSTRDDINPYHLSQLDEMARWLFERRLDDKGQRDDHPAGDTNTPRLPV